MTEQLEPASAVAAGICLTARTIAAGITARHPRACGWCDYEPTELRSMLDGFVASAGRNERTGAYRHHEAAVFQGLPSREQAALVLAAQSFPEPPEQPVAAIQPTQAHEDDEGGPVWRA